MLSDAANAAVNYYRCADCTLVWTETKEVPIPPARVDFWLNTQVPLTRRRQRF